MAKRGFAVAFVGNDKHALRLHCKFEMDDVHYMSESQKKFFCARHVVV